MNLTSKTKKSRTDWLVPAALILLSFIPIVAGSFRLFELASGADLTPDNARFFASPVPIVLHIISVSLYSILGAFQFAPAFRQRNPKWHRRVGKLLVVSGLIVALTGFWMTAFYPLPPELQGSLLYGFRLVISSVMFLAIILAYLAIRKRDIPKHRAWMIRAYAIAQAAGTQALLFIALIPVMALIPTIDASMIVGLPRDLLMILAWLINLGVAEWCIHKQTQTTPIIQGSSVSTS